MPHMRRDRQRPRMSQGKHPKDATRAARKRFTRDLLKKSLLQHPVETGQMLRVHRPEVLANS